MSANTKYHYRVRATNSIGSTNGADATFTTSGSTSTYTLSVTNPGGGTVTSSDGSINCTTSGVLCSAKYTSGASVTLTATPDTGYNFSGWGGACSGTSATCTVTMDSDKSVVALFTIVSGNTWLLSVLPTGKGTVTSADGAINCRADSITGACGASVNSGTSVTLTAKPDTGYNFSGWGGACSGTSSTCTVSNSSTLLSGAVTVTATFTAGSHNSVNDFDGDGKSDIFLRHSTTGGNVIFYMNGSTISSAAASTNVNIVWSLSGIGDFDGDGKSDLLWRYASSGANTVWLMNGVSISSYAALTSLGSSWQLLGVGDFDGDGKMDLLWRDSSVGTTAMWLMNGAATASLGAPGVVDATWAVAGVGDFDSDGKADIMWRNNSTGENVMWFMSGSSISSRTSMTTVALTWQVAGTGDFDGDGITDILWRNNSSGQHVVWIMDGATYSSTKSDLIATLADTGWEIAEIADFDGDGKSDVLLRHSTKGMLAIWFMNGASISSSGFVGQVSDSGWEVIPANGKASGSTSPDVAKEEVK